MFSEVQWWIAVPSSRSRHSYWFPCTSTTHRRQIVRALQQQPKHFVRCKKLTTRSNIFTGFESHSKATLLAIASTHGISVSRYTGNIEEIKDELVSHFAFGNCFINQPKGSPSPPGCESITTELSKNGNSSTDAIHTYAWWIANFMADATRFHAEPIAFTEVAPYLGCQLWPDSYHSKVMFDA